MNKSQTDRPDSIPPQQQDQRPGREELMHPKPQAENLEHKGSDKLKGRVALITGGDSGIGRAVAAAFAKEGADIIINYLEEYKDAEDIKRMVEAHGSRCIAIAGDVGDEAFCKSLVNKTIDTFGRLDILVNNAAEQHPQEGLEHITAKQLQRTFQTNIFSMFYLCKAALPHLHKGSVIVNCASVTAYKGNPILLDYSATKGAIVAFTRSLALSLATRDIRVNAVAPGPIWTPLIPSTFSKKHVGEFGKDTPMGRPGQPDEVAMAFLFLASSDASYITGQTIHVNGGSIVNA
ncbi:MAG TPA: SDR family oxidoreductase [Candidatus Saccharimonadales bacterium]|nr:SDR family oxidoreductase [Candidatus Saccharimonadales bacterium]